MIKTNAPHSQPLQRVCIRCGDSNVVSLSRCASCGFDLTSDLQRDYDFYRDGIPLDRPSGVGERQASEEVPPAPNTTTPGIRGVHWGPEPPLQASSGGLGTAGGGLAGTAQVPATMDLGAAVLEAVYGPTPSRQASIDTGDILDVDMPALDLNDPVAWSPSTAIRVEAPVVLSPLRSPSPRPSATAENWGPVCVAWRPGRMSEW